MGDLLKMTDFREELENVQIIEPLSHNWGKQEPNIVIFTNGLSMGSLQTGQLEHLRARQTIVLN